MTQKYLDPHQALRVQPETLAKYRAGARDLAKWAIPRGHSPQNAEEWDDMLVLYKNRSGISRVNFINVVAAVEFFYPRYKSQSQLQ